MRAVALPIDRSAYHPNRPRAENGGPAMIIEDIIHYDHLPPEVRKAVREAPCPIIVMATWGWLRNSHVSTERAVEYIKDLYPLGVNMHWQIMEREGYAHSKAAKQNGARGLQAI